MSETAERFRNVAAGFTACAEAVPDGAWDKPAPCEGWRARDVVGHLAGWMPMLFLGEGAQPDIPSAAHDPLGAWLAVRDAVQAALDDPERATQEIQLPMGRMTLAQAVDAFGAADVLVHTWDLARATGVDDTLDPDEVARVYAAMTRFDDEAMRSGGMFGPRVEVPDDADLQTKLIAYTGRRQ